MTYCITLRRGTSKLSELVPNPFDNINKICSKQNKQARFEIHVYIVFGFHLFAV